MAAGSDESGGGRRALERDWAGKAAVAAAELSVAVFAVFVVAAVFASIVVIVVVVVFVDEDLGDVFPFDFAVARSKKSSVGDEEAAFRAQEVARGRRLSPVVPLLLLLAV